MKKINTYIIEKLKINKDSKVNDFDSIINILDDSWENAGFSLSSKGDTEWLEKSKSSEKSVDFRYIEYNLFFKADKSSKATLRLDIFIMKVKEDSPSAYLKFRYNNGKYSYSVNSNINRIFSQEFPLSKDPITYNNVMGKRITHYECTNEVLEKLVNGIEELKYKKDIFKDAISKLRFTQQQWNKLVEEISDIFNIKY